MCVGFALMAFRAPFDFFFLFFIQNISFNCMCSIRKLSLWWLRRLKAWCGVFSRVEGIGPLEYITSFEQRGIDP